MCRRCGDCEGYSHHWMHNGEIEDENDPEFVCKHCDAVGDECSACFGDGCDSSADMELCDVCQGEGVIYIRGGGIVYSYFDQ